MIRVRKTSRAVLFACHVKRSSPRESLKIAHVRIPVFGLQLSFSSLALVDGPPFRRQSFYRCQNWIARDSDLLLKIQGFSFIIFTQINPIGRLVLVSGISRVSCSRFWICLPQFYLIRTLLVKLLRNVNWHMTSWQKIFDAPIFMYSLQNITGCMYLDSLKILEKQEFSPRLNLKEPQRNPDITSVIHPEPRTRANRRCNSRL
jgi:hypothetical protein